MRSVVARSLAVIGVGAVLLVGVLYVASTIDARAPEVLEIRLTQPLADEPNRALITTSLEVVFNETVDHDSAASALRLDPEVPGGVTWSGTTLIFTPSDPLQLETAYEVVVGSGIHDLSGNEMSTLPEPFAFETAGRPTITETVPEDGAEEIALDTVIELRFSTLMDTASVEAALRVLPAFAHELRWSGELLEIVPTAPLAADRAYRVTIGPDAADAAGVDLGAPVALAFRTVAPGLAVDTLVPADGIDGISTSTSIAVIFDRPVADGSVDPSLLAIEPQVAGTLEVVSLPGDEVTEDGSGRVLRFTPSAPLPPTTTFEVTLAPGIETPAGGSLPEPVTWTFTTGAPSAALSNQVTFLTDRGGVPNVWAMNADGTGQRQLSSELSPVLDYAVAPDGTSLVVSDGHRLVYARSDGGDRRTITDDGAIEFDPAYHPDSGRVVFARADAVTGQPMGLWVWEVGAGDAEPIELPDNGPEATPPPSASESDEAVPLRAPRYSPDGLALAFVGDGWIGLLELPDQRLTRVPFVAHGAPFWLPSSAALLVPGSTDGEPAGSSFAAPVVPLASGDDAVVVRIFRSATSVSETAFEPGWRVLAVSGEGTIAYVDERGRLNTTPRADSVSEPAIVFDTQVTGAAFGPDSEAMVIVVAGADDDRPRALELLDLATGRRTPLVPQGDAPRWLP
jgi:hypothetical protein